MLYIVKDNLKIYNSLLNVLKSKTINPFQTDVIDFIDQFSIEIKKNKNTKNLKEFLSLAFWCRKKNLILKKNLNNKIHKQKGLGIVFHVPPKNIEISFAYSLLFGILSGNTNIIKIDSRNNTFKIFYKIIIKVLNKKKYSFLKQMIFFIDYNKQLEITKKISLISDCRIVWGSDETIDFFKSLPTKTRSRNLFFSDRFSFSIINDKSLNNISKKNLYETVKKFYVNTFFSDQGACSSPHLIIWYKCGSNKNKILFWNALLNIVKKNYLMKDGFYIKKYDKILQSFVKEQNFNYYKSFENLINVVGLKKVDHDIHTRKGNFGLFFEYDLDNLSEISSFVTEKYQTLLYFGFKKKDLHKLIFDNDLKGIDRVVQFGNSLNIDLIWDGYDIIDNLTRIIEIE